MVGFLSSKLLGPRSHNVLFAHSFLHRQWCWNRTGVLGIRRLYVLYLKVYLRRVSRVGYLSLEHDLHIPRWRNVIIHRPGISKRSLTLITTISCILDWCGPQLLCIIAHHWGIISDGSVFNCGSFDCTLREQHLWFFSLCHIMETCFLFNRCHLNTASEMLEKIRTAQKEAGEEFAFEEQVCSACGARSTWWKSTRRIE